MATAVAPTPKWAREYETIYILRPNVEADRQEKIAERATGVIERLGGTLTKLDNWGTRRLAYPIQKQTRGLFVHLKFVGFRDLVSELERNLRLLDEVVRFQTILLQEQIDPASIEVDPEELKYLHIEDDTEEEELAVQRARSLGMTPEGEVHRPSEPGPAAEEATGAGREADAAAAESAAAESAAVEGAAAESAAVEGAAAESAAAEGAAAESGAAEGAEAEPDEKAASSNEDTASADEDVATSVADDEAEKES